MSVNSQDSDYRDGPVAWSPFRRRVGRSGRVKQGAMIAVCVLAIVLIYLLVPWGKRGARQPYPEGDDIETAGPGTEPDNEPASLAVARDKIEALGATGKQDAAGNYVLLDLTDCRASDADLPPLLGLSQLKEIRLRGPDITNEAIPLLTKFPRLVSVTLEQTRVDNAGVEALCTANEKLRAVNLSNSAVTGDGLRALAELSELKSLKLAGLAVSAADLAPLQACAQLTSLGLDDTAITDDGLAGLVSALPQLEELYLGGTQVGDAGVASVRQLTNLRVLRLSRTAVTDVGLAPLADCPALENIDLSESAVRGAGLVHLQMLPKLQRLNLYATPADATATRQLAGFRTLRWLNLDKTQINDAALADVAKLVDLVWLHIGSNRFGDQGVRHLQPLQNLNYLNVTRCPEVSDEAKQWLQATFPKADLQL